MDLIQNICIYIVFLSEIKFRDVFSVHTHSMYIPSTVTKLVFAMENVIVIKFLVFNKQQQALYFSKRKQNVTVAALYVHNGKS